MYVLEGSFQNEPSPFAQSVRNPWYGVMCPETNVFTVCMTHFHSSMTGRLDIAKKSKRAMCTVASLYSDCTISVLSLRQYKGILGFSSAQNKDDCRKQTDIWAPTLNPFSSSLYLQLLKERLNAILYTSLSIEPRLRKYWNHD